MKEPEVSALPVGRIKQPEVSALPAECMEQPCMELVIIWGWHKQLIGLIGRASNFKMWGPTFG